MFDKAKLCGTSLFLSSKIILIVSNESISFFLCQMISLFSCSMQLVVCQVWNLSLTTVEFSSQNPLNSLPNPKSALQITPQNPPNAPLFAPKQSSNVPSKSFPQRPLPAPTFSLQKSSQICPPNHSIRDPQMHPLFSPQTGLKCTPWRSSQICPNSTLKGASKCILFLPTRRSQKLEPQWQPPRP